MDDLRNKFTADCDEYLLPSYKQMLEKGYKQSYFYDGGRLNYHDNSKEYHMVLRVPGATRGHVVIDNGIITNIVFYPDTAYETGPRCVGCYSKDIVESIKNKWIGEKMR